MAIIDCPSCGSKISDRAPECVHCIKIAKQDKIIAKKQDRKETVKKGFGFFREVLSALAPRPVLKSPCPVCTVKVITKINPDTSTSPYLHDNLLKHISTLNCEFCKTQLALTISADGGAKLKDITWDAIKKEHDIKVEEIENQTDVIQDEICSVEDEIGELEDNETDEDLPEKQRKQVTVKIEKLNNKLEKLSTQQEKLEIKQEKLEEIIYRKESKYEEKTEKLQTKAQSKGLL